MTTKSRDAQRKVELAAIHAGRRSLGWDEDTYRTVLRQLTGKASAADLTVYERAAVLDKMRDLGFKRTRQGYTGRAPRRDGRPTQLDLIRTLWGELAATGALRDPSEPALQAFGERQTGKSRLEWCTPGELRQIIEALKSWAARSRRAAKRQEAES